MSLNVCSLADLTEDTASTSLCYTQHKELNLKADHVTPLLT